MFSFVALFVPLAILFYLKRDEWFVEQSGAELTAGAMLGVVYAMFVMRGALKEISSRMAVLISMFVFLAILYFFDSIINDLFWIVSMLIIGYIFHIMISSIGSRDIETYKSYRDERSRIIARNEAENEIGSV